jgi:cell division protein FtsL
VQWGEDLLSIFKRKLKSNELSQILSDSDVQNAFKSWTKLNRWSVFLFLLITSGLMIFYVNNVLSINKIAEDIRNLEKQEKRIEFRKRLVESEVIKLQSAERICKLAEEKLNMIKSDAFPLIIENLDD